MTFVFFLLALPASGQDTLKPSFEAVKINLPLTLSGKLDDPLWSQAKPVELNFEITPSENTPAGQKTTAFALYDNDNLYLGFRCYDSIPKNIRAHVCDRDQIFEDDYILVVIDTYNNYQRGYEFAVNPVGIQGDLLLMSSGGEDLSYDMVWHSAASINSNGWTAEIAIPFKALSFSNDESQVWTISLLRTYPRENRYIFSWTPNDRNDPSFMSQGGILTGLDGVIAGYSLDLLPYTMIEQNSVITDISDPASPMITNPVKARIGGSIKYAPNPTIDINAVFNPDFSQIESNVDQISVNSTFALFYPEKRPFFMSGMDLLQTPMYYSRTINNPLVAGKVNGKEGRLSYLALAAYDRNSAIIVPGEEQSNTVQEDLGSYAGVGRIRYDLGNENFAGLLMLSRNYSEAHNYVGGLDWSLKFWKNWYFKGELFLSNTRELNDTTLFFSERTLGSTSYDAGFNGEMYYGTGLHLVLQRIGRNYSFNLTQNNFSPTYQAYNGMFPSVNSRMTFFRQSYSFYPNKKFTKKISVATNMKLNYNYDGLFKEFVLEPEASVRLIGQTNISTSYLIVNTERFRDILFSGIGRTRFSVNSTPLRGFRLSVEGQIGKFIYRSSSPIIGKGYNLYYLVDLEPATRIKSSFSCSMARLTGIKPETELYNGYILRNSTTFQFTRKLFLRNIIQYNSFSSNFSIYPLVSYKFNAFTMFCAGMTSDMLDYGQDNISFKPTENQFFVKLQYLLSK